MNATTIAKQLAVYKNPMSTATTAPKIPDQKAAFTAGMRLQAVHDLYFEQEIIHLVVFPGMNNGCCIRGCGTAAEKQNMPYRQHCQVAIAGEAPNQTYAVSTNEQKWRVVSQGLKLTLVNNSDENDGWFECIRGATNNTEFGATTIGGKEIVGSAANIIPAFNQSETIVENNTYFSGKLRDIHRYLFQLHPQTNDHDFIPLADINATTYQGVSVDPTFDSIYIRIHGRKPGTAGSTLNPTRLMAHMVSNHEIIYDEKENLARFHTDTQRAPPGAIERVRDSLTYGNKAAKLLYGGL